MIRLDKLYKGGVMDKTPTEKKCSDCDVVKPLKEFKKNYKNRDGRLKRCRICEKKRIDAQKSTRQENGLFQHDKYYSF